jgi:hypothetical protein
MNTKPPTTFKPRRPGTATGARSAFAAVTAIAEPPYRVAAGTARATITEDCVTAPPAVTAGARQRPAVLGSAAGSPGADCGELVFRPDFYQTSVLPTSISVDHVQSQV